MAAVRALPCAAFLVVLSTIASGDVSYSPLPFLFAEGTHYDIGHQIVSDLCHRHN